MFAKSTFALALISGVEAWRSGEVKTKEKFKYGKFVARIQGDNKPGTVTSFFTYWNGPNWSVQGWNEIDVEIVPSVSNNPFSQNIIWQNQAQD